MRFVVGQFLGPFQEDPEATVFHLDDEAGLAEHVEINGLGVGRFHRDAAGAGAGADDVLGKLAVRFVVGQFLGPFQEDPEATVFHLDDEAGAFVRSER